MRLLSASSFPASEALEWRKAPVSPLVTWELGENARALAAWALAQRRPRFPTHSSLSSSCRLLVLPQEVGLRVMLECVRSLRARGPLNCRKAVFVWFKDSVAVLRVG